MWWGVEVLFSARGPHNFAMYMFEYVYVYMYIYEYKYVYQLEHTGEGMKFHIFPLDVSVL